MDMAQGRSRHRSLLSVPGSNWPMIEKALNSPADLAFIDLEDAVAPSGKAAARRNVIRALRELDWGAKPPAFRMNALDTPFFYRDLIEVIEEAGGTLRLIIVPKVSRPEDLHVVAALLDQIEVHSGLAPGGIALGGQIETAAGLVNVERTAAITSRLVSLHFGAGDFAASARIPLANIGVADSWDAHYPGHRFHYAMSRIAVAAHAAGLQPVDGPSADFRDLDAFRSSCRIARALGFTGKWCIHPAQIAIVNEVFAPAEEELVWARTVLSAYQQALAAGSGVIVLGNNMIDAASVKLAQSLLAGLPEDASS